jgi:hypothetical protein
MSLIPTLTPAYVSREDAMQVMRACQNGTASLAACYGAIAGLLRERDDLQREHTLASEALADAATQDAELKQLRARYDWLCAHLTQIHVETTQPADSPADSPMRVTLIQAWPTLPHTDAGSVDAAVAAAMKEGL